MYVTDMYILALEDGMPMFDINSNCDVFIQCPILFVGCDNPRASEFCHHMGSSATYFCRICEVGFNRAVIRYPITALVNKDMQVLIY